MKQCCKRFFNEPEYFAGVVLRLAFGILFLFAAINKFRLDGGYGGFAEILMSGEDRIAQEIPNFLLYAYAYVLPLAELVVGVLLISGFLVRYAYAGLAFIYITFIFGQIYSGNSPVVGTEYIPSLLALTVGFYAHAKSHKK